MFLLFLYDIINESFFRKKNLKNKKISKNTVFLFSNILLSLKFDFYVKYNFLP